MRIQLRSAYLLPEKREASLQAAGVADTGGTKINLPGANPLNGIAGTFITKSTPPPGVYRSGTNGNEEALVVYPDGAAQKVKPTIQSPDEFQNATKAIPEIGDLKVNVDSSITLKFEGQPLTLKPEFEVVPGATSSDSI